MLAAMFSAIGTGAMFLQDGGVYIFSQLPDTPMSWTGFFFRSGLPAFVILTASVSLVVLMVRDRWNLPVRSMLREQYEKLPPMSAPEKKLLVILLLMLLAFITINRTHGLNIAMILMLAALLLFVPRVNVLSNDDLKAFNHSIVFMTCGAMSIGIAASHVQATQLIKEALIPLFGACGGGFPFLISFLTGLIANFFLTPLAAISALTLPLHELAAELALPVEDLLIAFNLGLDQYLFPYEMTLIFFFTGTGYMNLSTMTRLLGAHGGIDPAHLPHCRRVLELTRSSAPPHERPPFSSGVIAVRKKRGLSPSPARASYVAADCACRTNTPRAYSPCPCPR